MVSILRSKIDETSFQSTLNDILREAMKINRAKLGNMQIINNQNNWLEIVAQRGFTSEFVEHFKFVTVDDGSICGRAMKSRRSVFVDDVNADSDFFPHLKFANDAGFRAVISTPLISSQGNIIGIISNHFSLPHRFTKDELLRFEKFCSDAADKIEKFILFQ
jgi:GAF domain-containing protein